MTDNNEEDPQPAKYFKHEIRFPPITNLTRWQIWRLMVLNICFLLIGHGAAVLLLRFYYEKGGHSKWAATLAQNAGFPILFIPFILFPSIKEPLTKCPKIIVVLVYLGLGSLIAVDYMLYSVGLAYLSSSTYSLISATQLFFGAIFSFFINSQKFTTLTLNSIVVLTLSASLVGVSDDMADQKVTGVKYTLGVMSTLCGSALYALLLSLTQLSLQKIIKKKTFAVVLEMQICTSIVASCVSLVGLFASGEWRWLRSEMDTFDGGRLSYAMTLIWTAMAWQVCSVGVVGLIFVVSSLFSNVVINLALSLLPLATAVAFNYTMNGGKVIAVLMGIWGFSTFVYQKFLDLEEKNNNINTDKPSKCPC